MVVLKVSLLEKASTAVSAYLYFEAQILSFASSLIGLDFVTQSLYRAFLKLPPKFIKLISKALFIYHFTSPFLAMKLRVWKTF